MNNQTPYCLVYDLVANKFAHSTCYNCDAELFAMGFLVVKRFQTLEESEFAHAQKNLMKAITTDVKTSKKAIKKQLFISKDRLLLLSLLSLEGTQN